MTRHAATPRDTAPRRRGRYGRRGLTIAETLICLAITSMLLTAASAAFVASANAVTMNSNFFRAVQGARVSMNQVLIEVRKADAVQVSSDHVDVIRPAALLAPNEIFRRFQYDATNKRLTLQIYYAGNTAGPLYELATGITAATFGPAVMGQDYNNATVVQRVPVMLTVTVGTNVVTLNGASGPRRALSF